MMEKTVAMWLHRRRYEALLPQIRKEQHASKEKAEKAYARHMEEARKKEEEERRRREQEERCVLLLLLLRLTTAPLLLLLLLLLLRGPLPKDGHVARCQRMATWPAAKGWPRSSSDGLPVNALPSCECRCQRMATQQQRWPSCECLVLL